MSNNVAITARALAAQTVLSLFMAIQGQAADIRFVDGKAHKTSENHGVRTHCNVIIEGAITTGDFDTFEQLLLENKELVEHSESLLRFPKVVNLCLNSPGGSLTEALKIAEFIRRDRPDETGTEIPFVTTRLEKGAHCESACAIVFMSGTLSDPEDEAYIARSIHPTAKLGFHAPALNVQEGEYTKTHVNSAFDISIQSMSSILRILVVGQDSEGTLWKGYAPWMAASLVEEMFATPARNMRYIETVDDAGRWNIDVYPLRRTMLNYDTGWMACHNQKAWRNWRSSILDSKHVFSRDEEGGFAYLDGSVETQHSHIRMTFLMDHFQGTGCEISYFLDDGGIQFEPSVAEEDWMGGHAISGKENGDAYRLNIGSDALWFNSPEVLLTSLRPDPLTSDFDAKVQKASAASKVDWAPRFGGDKVSLWNHEGSLMAWESIGNKRLIWFFEPSDGLSASGIEAGTLLFEGEMKNGTLVGNARQFSAECGEVIFSVSGRPAGTQVILKGAQKNLNVNCQSNGQTVELLTFTYLAKNPNM